MVFPAQHQRDTHERVVDGIAEEKRWCPIRAADNEIADIVGRSSVACRKLASSARHRVRHARPVATPSVQRAEVVRTQLRDANLDYADLSRATFRVLAHNVPKKMPAADVLTIE